MDSTKLDAVRRYLTKKFDDSVVEDQYDFDNSAQTFKVSQHRGHYLAKLDEDFLGDQDAKALEDWLADSGLDNALQTAPDETVWVMSDGKLAVRPRG